MDTGIREYKDTWIHEYMDTWPDTWIHGYMAGYMDTWIYEYTNTRIHGYMARAAVVHLNFRAGSTFPVPVCTALPGHWVNKADTQ